MYTLHSRVAGLTPSSVPPFRAAQNAPQIHHHNDQPLQRLIHHFPRTHLTHCSHSFSSLIPFLSICLMAAPPCNPHTCPLCVFNALYLQCTDEVTVDAENLLILLSFNKVLIFLHSLTSRLCFHLQDDGDVEDDMTIREVRQMQYCATTIKRFH